MKSKNNTRNMKQYITTRLPTDKTLIPTTTVTIEHKYRIRTIKKNVKYSSMKNKKV